jgi:hypothetical protein
MKMKMKKILLIALLPFASINAQITLNQSDFANGGDTIRMSTSSDLTLDFSSTGSNHVWDYSSLVPSSQKLNLYRPSSQFSPSTMFAAMATLSCVKVLWKATTSSAHFIKHCLMSVTARWAVAPLQNPLNLGQ